jgi:hypothetical protein
MVLVSGICKIPILDRILDPDSGVKTLMALIVEILKRGGSYLSSSLCVPITSISSENQ